MASLHVLANPARFRRFSQRVLPALSVVTALALAVGLWLALIESPPDYQQGETVRIMFIHVPSAWLAMMGYGLLAALGAALLVWRHPLAALMARGAAPVGAVEAVAIGEGFLTHLAILGALALLSLATLPWAIAAALRQAGE